MLNITLITVSHKQPAWVVQAYDDYIKRLPARELKWVLKELKPEAREGKTTQHAMALEGEKIRAAIPKGAYVVVLDERGEDWSSVQLAQQLSRWQQDHSHVALIVGGADGLDADLKHSAQAKLRLSSLTLPHGLVRVLLAEQFYRAFAINTDHPYHRA